MARYGRKGTEGAPGEGSIEERLAQLTLENDQLRQQIIDIETLKAGGSVPLVNGAVEDESDGVTRVAFAGEQPDLGPDYLVRVLTSRVPAGVKTAQQVTLSGTDKHGRRFEWSRRIITDTPVKMPLCVIKHLETPQEDEYLVPPESMVWEDYLRGNLDSAHADCRRLGFDKVVARPDGLRYVRYVRNFTVIVEGAMQERLVVAG